MKKQALISIIIGFCLFTSGNSFAQDRNYDVSGEIELGGMFLKENGNSAKFKEYRDIDDGVIGHFRFDAAKDGNYLTLLGENVGLTKHHVGLDDQFFMLKGGKYDSYKYSLFYNETPHNLSFDARTFFTGVGGSNLTFTGAPPTPANFRALYTNSFDYRVNRRDYGAAVELSFNTPFYLSVAVTENDKKGLQPLGAAAAGPGGAAVELPMPVQYFTKNFNVEAGYRTKNVIFSIDGMVSDFDNSNQYLTWTDPALVTLGVANRTQISSIAPDNTFWRIGGKFLARLPLDSTLTLKGSYARSENDIPLLTSIVTSTTTAAVPAGTLLALGNADTFNGRYTYTTVSADVTTHPVAPLDVRLFYNFLNRGNDSTTITFTNPFTGDTSTNDIFSYSKHDAGFEFGYRFPLKTKAVAGYEYTRVNRQPDVRPDAVNTTDNKVFVQVKNSFFEFLTGRVRYSHLERRSDFENQDAGADPTDQDFVQRFFRRFDATDKSQDAVKLTLEIMPSDNLQIGVEYAFRLNDYTETFLGRNKDKRHEVYVDATYTWPERVSISGYFDYERAITDSSHRNFTTSADPTVPPTTTNYNWSATLKDDNYAYGFGVNVPILKNRLNIVAAWGYEKADGHAEFASQDNIVSLVNIGNYDDYTKKAINAKAIYRLNRNVDVTAGYAYERLKYNDISYAGYTLVPGTAFLTGAYADHDYEAHLWFMSATYRF